MNLNNLILDMSTIDWTMFLICFAFILLDIISGVIKACVENDFSSSKMREGLMHKAGTLMVLLCAGLCDVCMSIAKIELPYSVGIVDTFGVLVIAMEISSVLENCIAINPDLKNLPLFKIFGVDNTTDKN